MLCSQLFLNIFFIFVSWYVLTQYYAVEYGLSCRSFLFFLVYIFSTFLMSPKEKKKEKNKKKETKHKYEQTRKQSEIWFFAVVCVLARADLIMYLLASVPFFFDFLHLNAKLLYFLKLFHVISHQYICFGYLSILGWIHSGRRSFPEPRVWHWRLPPRHEIDVASVTSIPWPQASW